MRQYKHNGLRLRTNTKNTGMTIENCINIVNNFYYSRGLGLIQKQYTPFIPLRDNVGKVIDVKVADKAISDYAGIYGKYAVAFEVKSCSSDKFDFHRLKQHQLDTLSRYTELGHIAFLFLSFKEQDFYILPYPVISGLINKTSEQIVWKNIIQHVCKFKYITKNDINDFFKIQIKSNRNSLSFLDYMAAVGRIYEIDF